MIVSERQSRYVENYDGIHNAPKAEAVALLIECAMGVKLTPEARLEISRAITEGSPEVVTATLLLCEVYNRRDTHLVIENLAHFAQGIALEEGFVGALLALIYSRKLFGRRDQPNHSNLIGACAKKPLSKVIAVIEKCRGDDIDHALMSLRGVK